MHVEWTCPLIAIILTVSAYEVLEVLEGDSVTLKIRGHVDKIDTLEWRYITTAIVDYRRQKVYFFPSYKSRVEFDEQTFSLRLRNLMKSDSGLYTAEKKTVGKPKEIVAEYYIYVLEPASTPTLTVLSNWSSSDSCNVTLKCTGLNVSLISSCNGTFCSQEGGSRFLSISLSNNIVSCNHSNHLSWRQTIMDLETVCQLHTDTLAPPIGVSVCLLRALLVSVGLIAMVTAVITVNIRLKLHKSD